MSNGKEKFNFLINNKQATTDDRSPTAAQILADAGFEPVDDYVLIQRTAHGSRIISSSDVLDVEGEQAEFFAFEGGMIFELTVNSHSIFWGEDKIEVNRLRELARVSDDSDLVWMREGAQNEVLKPGSSFDLAGRGVEHLRTHKRATQPAVYHYFVGGTEFTTEHESLTGAQITAKISDWNPANSLVLEGEGSEADEVIHPSTTVEFKGRATPAQFAIVPPATFGAA